MLKKPILKFYRLAVASARDKRNKAIPAVRNFALSKNDNGKLSVDCECFTTPEECVARVGASFKADGTYKSHLDREIYSISSTFISESDLIRGVLYDPTIVDPPQKGKPQNFSHSLLDLVVSDPDELEPEICLRIREHAKDRRVVHDLDVTNHLVAIYRSHWD